MKPIDYAEEVNAANEIVVKLLEGGNVIKYTNNRTYGPWVEGKEVPRVEVFTRKDKDRTTAIRMCFENDPSREMVTCINFTGLVFVAKDLIVVPHNTIKLTPDYSAIVERYEVKVGCQTIPWSVVKELVKKHDAKFGVWLKSR